jgi:hypothetical protein
VLPAFRELLPRGGLARGSVVAVAEFGLLCLALAAGASGFAHNGTATGDSDLNRAALPSTVVRMRVAARRLPGPVSPAVHAVGTCGLFWGGSLPL